MTKDESKTPGDELGVFALISWMKTAMLSDKGQETGGAMLELYHITHTLTQPSTGLVEQFFVLFHRRSFF
jgi:hypothetical protein